MELSHIARQFGVGEVISAKPLDRGHINVTFHVECESGQYILQSLNTGVFTSPEIISHNISVITERFRSESDVTVPEFLTAKGGYFLPHGGKLWRMYRYIRQTGTQRDDLTGYAFGRFIKIMEGAPLKAALPEFHRMKNYTDILPEDNAYSDKLRRSECELSEIFRDVPMRAVHGDARFDNVIIGERCTVIDLDTAMIGYAALDYGDMIRSVCTDRNALHRSEELTSGFLRGVGDALSQRERESLYYGVLRVTGELAARYFADALSGGHYFGKTPRQCMARAESLMSQLEMFISEENALKALL